MKKLYVAAIALLMTSSAAYAASPEAAHSLARACGLPCC